VGGEAVVPAQLPVHEDAKVGPNASDHVAQHQTVEHAERVVGHDDERARAREGTKPVTVVDRGDVELIEGHLPERPVVVHGPGVRVEPFEDWAARDTLDEAN
jgi:hypothetical protein